MSKRTPPTKLGPRARKLWNELTVTYELRPDELRILEDACREIDLIDRLEAELVVGEMVVAGSQGQPVANPLVSEIRQHRSTLQRLLGSLKLPDEDGRQGAARSEAAREAAHARWRRSA